MTASFTLRPYQASDEDAAIALWQTTWQQAYPKIDFAARVPWWRERWRGELVPNAAIVVAEQEHRLLGFVTIDQQGYLDQIVVAPDHWGSELATMLVNPIQDRIQRWSEHRFQRNLVKLALRFRITRPPRLDDPEFINRVVFDPNAAEVGTPKERFA